MKYIILCMTALVTFTMTSCKRSNHNRNILVFENKTDDVRDSIFKVLIILNKFPLRNDNRNRNYIIKDKKLYVNDTLVTAGDKKFSRNLSFADKESLLRLTAFLNKNYLSTGYFDYENQVWYFYYRFSPELTFDDSRVVSLLDSKTNLTDTILDHRGDLYLLAPKGAKIWQ